MKKILKTRPLYIRKMIRIPPICCSIPDNLPKKHRRNLKAVTLLKQCLNKCDKIKTPLPLKGHTPQSRALILEIFTNKRDVSNCLKNIFQRENCNRNKVLSFDYPIRHFLNV